MEEETKIHAESPLSPRSSKFINDFRNKNPVSKSSLTKEEEDALRGFLVEEFFKQKTRVKRFHETEIVPLLKKAKATIEEDKTDFFVDGWKTILAETDKYVRDTRLLTENMNEKMKILDSTDQQVYVAEYAGKTDPDLRVLSKKEFRLFMVDGIERFLRERVQERESQE
jgi:hypothetical protein